jgi:hypothetical protein
MRTSLKVTISAGNPVRLLPVNTPDVFANDLIITPLGGASAGLIYVLNQDPLTDPPVVSDNTKVTVLIPAGSTNPATPFILNRTGDGDKKLLINEWSIDGAHTADTVQVSWEPNQ